MTQIKSKASLHTALYLQGRGRTPPMSDSGFLLPGKPSAPANPPTLCLLCGKGFQALSPKVDSLGISGDFRAEQRSTMEELLTLHYLFLFISTMHFNTYFSLIQFSSVAQSCPTLCNPMNRSTPGLPVHHQLPESTQTHVHRVCDAIQPSHPLLSPSPPALNLSQHQGLFQ